MPISCNDSPKSDSLCVRNKCTEITANIDVKKNIMIRTDDTGRSAGKIKYESHDPSHKDLSLVRMIHLV